MDYFRVFGTKNCIFDDLRVHVSPDGLPGEEVERFVKEVETLVASQPINFECPLEEVRENVSHSITGRGCGWLCVRTGVRCGYHLLLELLLHLTVRVQSDLDLYFGLLFTFVLYSSPSRSLKPGFLSFVNRGFNVL